MKSDIINHNCFVDDFKELDNHFVGLLLLYNIN